MTAVLPLLAPLDDSPVAWWSGRPVDRITFLSQALALAEGLPPGAMAINHCQDRYRFLLGFAAVVASGGCNLLPAHRSPGALLEVAADYPGCYCLCDQPWPNLDLPQYRVEPAGLNGRRALEVPGIAADHLAAVVFTSGSTGRPRPNPKRWGDLVVGGGLTRRRFDLGPGVSLVATVPPQHMYGLETSILQPLLSGIQVHGSRPFFAADIQAALADLPAPRVLVTTPFHLRVCVEAGLIWPDVRTVISATAPLAPELAQAAEVVLGAPVMEIYGCSEAGSLASRDLLRDPVWQLYDGLVLHQDGEVTSVRGPHLPEAVVLADIIQCQGASRFVLRGRQGDLVNVAGKRASLSDLNHRLNAVSGVKDGVFVVAGGEGEVQRLAALAVAPGMERAGILAELRRVIDPVFLPRPLHLMERLPRDETGKLPRQTLERLLRELEAQA